MRRTYLAVVVWCTLLTMSPLGARAAISSDRPGGFPVVPKSLRPCRDRDLEIGPARFLTEAGAGNLWLMIGADVRSRSGPCHFEGIARISLLDEQGRPLPIERNGALYRFEFDVPPRLVPGLYLQWTTWCGTNASRRLVVEVAGRRLTTASDAEPRCVNGVPGLKPLWVNPDGTNPMHRFVPGTGLSVAPAGARRQVSVTFRLVLEGPVSSRDSFYLAFPAKGWPWGWVDIPPLCVSRPLQGRYPGVPICRGGEVYTEASRESRYQSVAVQRVPAGVPMAFTFYRAARADQYYPDELIRSGLIFRRDTTISVIYSYATHGWRVLPAVPGTGGGGCVLGGLTDRGARRSCSSPLAAYPTTRFSSLSGTHTILRTVLPSR